MNKFAASLNKGDEIKNNFIDGMIIVVFTSNGSNLNEGYDELSNGSELTIEINNKMDCMLITKTEFVASIIGEDNENSGSTIMKDRLSILDTLIKQYRNLTGTTYYVEGSRPPETIYLAEE